MAHPLSALKIEFPPWRIVADEYGDLHARRLYEPGLGREEYADSIDAMRRKLRTAENELHPAKQKT